MIASVFAALRSRLASIVSLRLFRLEIALAFELLLLLAGCWWAGVDTWLLIVAMGNWLELPASPAVDVGGGVESGGCRWCWLLLSITMVDGACVIWLVADVVTVVVVVDEDVVL